MSPREVFKFFNKDLFLELNPPFINIELHQFDGVAKGDILSLTTSILGYYQTWKNEIIDEYHDDDEVYFIDEAQEMPFPFTSWKHIHKIKRVDNQYSYVIDDIYYQCDNFIFEVIVYPVVWLTMLYRKPIYLDKFRQDS